MTTSPRPHILHPTEITLLQAIQNTLLPGDVQMPTAEAVATAMVVDSYLGEQVALRAPILGALAAVRIATASHGGDTFTNLAEGIRVAVLREVESAEPDLFDALLVQSYTAYYSSADVQNLLGVPSPLQPTGHAAMMRGAIDATRLDRVRATAPPWRPA